MLAHNLQCTAKHNFTIQHYLLPPRVVRSTPRIPLILNDLYVPLKQIAQSATKQRTLLTVSSSLVIGFLEQRPYIARSSACSGSFFSTFLSRCLWSVYSRLYTMVRLFSTEHTFSHPFSRVSSAFWRKYPNDNAPHVQAIDCYERKIIHLHQDGTTSLHPPASSLTTASSPTSSTLSSSPASSFDLSSPLSSSSSSSDDSLLSLSSELSAPDSNLSPIVDANTLSASPPTFTPPPTTTPLLVSNRIISCETALPAWLNRLGVSNHAYAIETSVINPRTQEMVVKSRNVTGASLMVMEETCLYKGRGWVWVV